MRFAIRDAALLELMFGAKNAKNVGPPDTLRAAAEGVFTAFGDLIDQGQRTGVLPSGDPERLRLLVVAALQGIAALVTSGRVQPGQVDPLIADAIALFTNRQR